MSGPTVYLHAIETAVPDRVLTQEDSLRWCVKYLGDTEEKREFLTKVFTHSAIQRRHVVLPTFAQDPVGILNAGKTLADLPQPSTKERNEIYIRESNRLALKVTRQLLKRFPGSIREQITHVITVSCTGMVAPGMDFHVVSQLKLAPEVNRFHIGFMGCFAAFPALKLAHTICRAEPDARVLVVAVELCSLHAQPTSEPDTLVASALFADGAAACLVSTHRDDGRGPRLVLKAFHSEYLPDSEEDMAWKIGDAGFEMRLSAYVPKLLEANIVPVIGRLSRKSGVELKDITLWAIHPGGRAILEKLEKTLNLKPFDLSASYEVLRDYGNMSSPTVLFVLKKILDRPVSGTVFSAAFGPGLTVETGVLEKLA